MPNISEYVRVEEEMKADGIRSVLRDIVERIIEKGSEEDIYGLLSGLSGFMQHILKKERERPTPTLSAQGGAYI